VLSDETRKLVGESFVLDSLGGLDLKGFAEPLRAWRVVGNRTAPTRFEVRQMQGLVEFIGRDGEVALLLDRWALAGDGEGQVVLLSESPALANHASARRCANDSQVKRWPRCCCNALPYFSTSALYPVVQHLERAAGMAPGDLPEVRAAKLEQLAGTLPAASLGCLLRLMGLPDGNRKPQGGAAPHEEKVHTLEALIDLLRRLSEQQPVLFLVEDAHWIDPTTEELIGQVAQRVSDWRVLLLVTCRPVRASWSNASQLTRHSLNRLSHKQCASAGECAHRGQGPAGRGARRNHTQDRWHSAVH
jgi:predicted ATPase